MFRKASGTKFILIMNDAIRIFSNRKQVTLLQLAMHYETAQSAKFSLMRLW